MAEQKNERAFYRIVYPIADRPKFICRGETMDVIDVSEQGLAVAVEKGTLIGKNSSQVLGKIIFKDGDTVSVTGKVLRKTETSLILLLSEGVPLPIIIKQQRYILQKYGAL